LVQLGAGKGRMGPEEVEIVVRGRISPPLLGALEGFEVSSCEEGLTHLVGWVADQAALRGVLMRLSDLNIELVSLNPRGFGDQAADEPVYETKGRIEEASDR